MSAPMRKAPRRGQATQPKPAEIDASEPPLELVDAGRRAGEQRLLFVSRRFGRQPLERIPQHAIATGDLVDREVALEHAAVGPEQLYARVDPGPERVGQSLRAGRR